MTDDLDALLADLAKVQDELLSEDLSFEQKAVLRQRQEELRQRARQARDEVSDHLTIDQMKAQLAHLEQRRDEHLSSRLGHSAAAQTGRGGGIDPRYVHELHARMAEAFGLEELEAEIKRLRDRIAAAES